MVDGLYLQITQENTDTLQSLLCDDTFVECVSEWLYDDVSSVKVDKECQDSGYQVWINLNVNLVE